MVWISSVAGLALLIGVVFFFKSRASLAPSAASSSPLVVGTPLHTLPFDDGSSLQILQIGDGRVVDGDMSAKPKSSMFSSHSTGSRSSGMSGGGVRCSIRRVTINDQITGIQFDSSPANLVIETRLLNPRQMPMESKRILWANEIRKDGASSVDFPGWDPLLSAPVDDSNLPELVVQLSDGVGGWIDGCGPCSLDDDPEHRGMIAFVAWPRTAAELEFRAARPGMKPVTWKMKNPSQALTPAAWKASPLPQKHVESDFELELKAAVKFDGLRMIHPKFQFVSKVPGDTPPTNAKMNGRPALECNCEELQGEWGTRTEKAYVKQPGNSVAIGFPYPPDERTVRLRFVISPSEFYPYPRFHALMIAKAKIAADGKSIVARPAILTGQGILTVEFLDVTTGDEGGFRYIIKGRWDNEVERKNGEAAIGNNNRIPVCYVGEAEVSSGAADSNSSSSSGSGNVTEFEYEGYWKGSLKPGDEISLGMTTPLPTREVYFTFDP